MRVMNDELELTVVLDKLVNHLSNGIAVVSSDGQYVFVNQAMADIFHVPVQDLLGLHVSEFSAHSSFDIGAHIGFALQSEPGQSLTLIEDSADKDTPYSYYIELSTFELKGENAVLLNVMPFESEVSDDVSEDPRSVMQDADYNLKNVLDNLFAFVAVLEVDGTLIDVNQAPLNIAALRFEDVYKKKFWDCYWWSYDEAIQLQLKDAISRAVNGETVRYEVIVRTVNDGRMLIDFMLAPLKDSAGKIIKLIPSGMDISERAQKEQQIALLERRNAALLDHSPVCHKIVDLDLNLKFMNANGFNMLSLPINDDWYGKRYPFSFFPKSAKDQMQEKLETVLSTRKKVEFEAYACDSKGQEVWLFHTIIPVFKENGRDLDYLTIVSADITQQKAVQEQLQHREKLDAIGQLAGGVAHDFNNQLASIIGYAQLLAREVQSKN
ncbi:PAS domain-containing protein [Alteromonas facilis]|uniref:PAS domain-containing protein n=1 Tax=Alteromonas facilis TaxID=2048004 RepID=UPI000C289EC1|nr:PAS domain-containing protein [Alteromonas facilis]